MEEKLEYELNLERERVEIYGFAKRTGRFYGKVVRAKFAIVFFDRISKEYRISFNKDFKSFSERVLTYINTIITKLKKEDPFETTRFYLDEKR